MKKSLILLVLMFIFVLMGCSQISTTNAITSTTTTSTTTTTTNTSVDTTTSILDTITNPIISDYLYEDTPLNEAIVFGPDGYLSNDYWHWHGTPVFSPDGKEMYWSKYIKASNDIEIWYTKEIDSVWSEPQKFIIEGIEGAYNCPVFASHGTELYFLNFDGISFTIYKVTRDGDTWINPEAININIPQGKVLGWSFSVAENKNLYFLLWDLNGLDHQKIYRSIYNDGVYDDPQPLDILDNGSEGVGGPSIAPDESYILFDSVRSNGFGMHDLYVSFTDDLGAFTTPINLGNQVNTAQEEVGASISPDGFYMFYTTLKTTDLGYNPYWIKIDELEAFQTE